MSERDFSRLSKYIEENLGIFLKPEKILMLESRLQKVLRKNNFADIETFVNELFDPNASDRSHLMLVEAVTTNETYFFRESIQFTILSEQIKKMIQGGFNRTLRVWSTAASTGQEAYTLAMVLEEIKEVHPQFDYKIYSTDISNDVLARAKKAIYSEYDIEKIPERLRKKYLLRAKDPTRDEFRIIRALRQKVIFKFYNLKEQRAESFVKDFDVILCRNVMIYFRQEFQRNLASFLCDKLVKGGILCMGHSEGMIVRHLKLESLGSVVYKK